MTYKILKDSFDLILKTSDNLPLTSNDLSGINSDLLNKEIRSSISQPLFRLFLLNYDESIREDISDDIIIGSGSLSINYANGQRRGLSLELRNINGKWNPSPVKGTIWKGVKFRFDIGIQIRENQYWKQAGIFVLNEPSYNKNQTVSISLVDKFGSFDGTIGGKTNSIITIPQGSVIKDVVNSLLQEKRMTGIPYDIYPVLLPLKYVKEKTPYTLTKSPNSNVGELIISLAEMINCEVYYNEYGHLVFEDIANTLSVCDKSPIFSFLEDDITYNDISLQFKLNDFYNVVTVVGANINGDLVDYTAYNTNLQSPTNIYVTEQNPIYISDDNISTVAFAKQRADYELFKQSLLPILASFNSIFIPFLNVNEVVSVTKSALNLKNDLFLLKSINIPVSFNTRISINAANINEVI